MPPYPNLTLGYLFLLLQCTYMKIEIEADQVIEKPVVKGGNSGRVIVPVSWVGRQVKVLLLPEPESSIK